MNTNIPAELEALAHEAEAATRAAADAAAFINEHQHLVTGKVDIHMARASLVLSLGPATLSVLHRGDNEAMLRDAIDSAHMLTDFVNKLRAEMGEEDTTKGVLNFHVEGPDTLQ